METKPCTNIQIVQYVPGQQHQPQSPQTPPEWIWTRSQFVRLPDGLRQNGARQCVYYFNPEVIR